MNWVDVICRARGVGKTNLIIEAANKYDKPVVVVAYDQKEVHRIKPLLDKYRVRVVSVDESEKLLGLRPAPILFDPDAVGKILISHERVIDQQERTIQELRKELLRK